MKLVLIEWIDSHSGEGWQRLAEIQDTTRPTYCRSVGWLVSEAEGCKTLVPHLSGEKNEGVAIYGSGDITIPDAAIVKLKVLRS